MACMACMPSGGVIVSAAPAMTSVGQAICGNVLNDSRRPARRAAGGRDSRRWRTGDAGAPLGAQSGRGCRGEKIADHGVGRDLAAVAEHGLCERRAARDAFRGLSVRSAIREHEGTQAGALLPEELQRDDPAHGEADGHDRSSLADGIQ